jgi:hypothetical protein
LGGAEAGGKVLFGGWLILPAVILCAVALVMYARREWIKKRAGAGVVDGRPRTETLGNRTGRGWTIFGDNANGPQASGGGNNTSTVFGGTENPLSGARTVRSPVTAAQSSAHMKGKQGEGKQGEGKQGGGKQGGGKQGGGKQGGGKPAAEEQAEVARKAADAISACTNAGSAKKTKCKDNLNTPAGVHVHRPREPSGSSPSPAAPT